MPETAARLLALSPSSTRRTSALSASSAPLEAETSVRAHMAWAARMEVDEAGALWRAIAHGRNRTRAGRSASVEVARGYEERPGRVLNF